MTTEEKILKRFVNGEVGSVYQLVYCLTMYHKQMREQHGRLVSELTRFAIDHHRDTTEKDAIKVLRSMYMSQEYPMEGKFALSKVLTLANKLEKTK